MYCMNCGVRLAESETRCPLCGTAAYHPDLPRRPAVPAYPHTAAPRLRPSRRFLPTLATILLLLGAAVPVIVDLSLGGGLSWSWYVITSVALFYVLFVLPCWFRRPNPVIFLAIDFVGIELFLLYIDLANRGGWFLSYAFPVAGIPGLIIVTAAILLYYVRRGVLFILGGCSIALGGYCMLLELFSVITFGGRMFQWSLYPLSALSALGLFLIFTAICRPWRELLRRKFFL